MQPTRHIVIRDGPPLFNPALTRRPADWVALACAALSLCVQAVALVQVSQGFGNQVGLFDHVAFAAVALLWLLLGIAVFLQRAGTDSGRFFLLSSAAGSGYLGLGTLSGVSGVDAVLYAVGLLTFAPMMFGFVRSLQNGRRRRRFGWVVYLPPVLLIWPMASDLIGGRKSMGYRISIVCIGAYLLACLAQSLWNLARAETPAEASQTRALVLGLIGGTVPGLLVFVVPLAVFGRLLVVTTWQPLFAVLFILAMAYAALLYEFSMVDLIIGRGLVYGLMTAGVILAYGALGLVLVAHRITVITPLGGLGFVAVTVALGAGFGPVRSFALAAVDRSIYGDRTDRWQGLQALNARLTTIMQPAEVGAILVRDLQLALHLRGAILIRRNSNGDYETANTAWDHDFSRPDRERSPFPVLPGPVVERCLGHPAAPLLLTHSRPLLPSRSSTVPGEYRAFDDLGAALVFPLQTRSGVEAILCLQPKRRHDPFTAADLGWLGPIVGQAGVALDNSLLLSRLEDAVAELKAAYSRLANEQELERSRLARELHDGTAQELAAVITLATVLERQLEGGNRPALETLRQIQRQAAETYSGVRHASHALRPVMLDGYGLVPALRSYIDALSARTGLAIDFVASDIGALPADAEWCLFRVAQECLENVRKHSGSTTAVVSILVRANTVSLSVIDHGRGMGAESGATSAPGIGMSNMRERLAAVGGDLRVTSSEDGVRVDATVPLQGASPTDIRARESESAVSDPTGATPADAPARVHFVSHA